MNNNPIAKEPNAAAPSEEQDSQQQQDQDPSQLAEGRSPPTPTPPPPPHHHHHQNEQGTTEPTITAPSTATSSSSRSKKRNRDSSQGTTGSTPTPAALSSSLQQIHQTLTLSPHFASPTSPSLPAFQALIQSYLIPTKQSINVPHLIRNNMLSSLASLAQKHLNDVPPYVHLNTKDAAPQLSIDADKLTVKGGMRGYRMVRGSQGVEAGGWYYEVEVLQPPSVQEVIQSLPENVRLGEGVREGFRKGLEREQKRAGQSVSNEGREDASQNQEEEQPLNKKKKRRIDESDEDGGTAAEVDGVQQYSIGGHLRIGWSMRTGELQAPVGYDRWSYGIRDIQGSRIHNSRREDKWGGVGFRPGDVVGFAIYLIDHKEDNSHNMNPNAMAAGGGTSTKKNPNIVAQTNHVRFFKNGAPMGHFIVSRGIKSGGEAFDNIEAGTYYPAISSYMGGTARVNFGPYFIYPPKGLPTGMKLQPMSDIYPKPKAPSEVLDAFKKEKCILKKVEEAITQAFYDAVYLEAEMRHGTYQKHLADHVDFVRRKRMDRGLSTSDLPDPAPTTTTTTTTQSSASSPSSDAFEPQTEPKTETETAADAGEENVTGTETMKTKTVQPAEAII